MAIIATDVARLLRISESLRDLGAGVKSLATAANASVKAMHRRVSFTHRAARVNLASMRQRRSRCVRDRRGRIFLTRFEADEDVM
jgi:hypothetical protein